ncbi:hypothetical protein CDG77_14015 [Nostoc sp. 'Peltigera membranacea cyanobiont' 213]|uniref:collagen-like triple helix repeat-containing protein n=1 Tax=Nostoc sp. 'Peltigera membranacea cyanobiont' 213 TaxID=2014530 RepID=UPI000B95B719|nr:collagen-like protein [Nostoc sp. 'Peltigera membranacea cyanobiont' 213]OYD92764.1 hypothetical protein CDG77_14015 [Nostoc sp. 'Peltigera membranacea cyanobiont' 213]
MSASSTISNLKSALDCASKCDCCDKLQQQINAINAKLITEAKVRSIAQTVIAGAKPGIIATTKSVLEPGIASAVVGGIAVVIDRLKPDVDIAKGLAKQGYDTAKIAERATNDALARSLAEARARVAAEEALRGEIGGIRTVANSARVESAGAIRNAATAANQALEANNAVGGLRGLINGIGAKVDGFGRAIGRLENAVGGAVASAAKAVGISSEALAATGRLAGKVFEIFQVVGTLFTIIEQLETLRILGDRIDAVERGLDFLGNSVSVILGKLLGLQNRISRNEASIVDVKSLAFDARLIGEGAARIGGAAQITATRAEVLAASASGKASQAQLTANGAVRNAKTANENATTAYKKATEAEGIGQQAKQLAGQALRKAGVALTTALTAIALYQGIKSLRGLQGIPGLPGRQGERGFQGFQGLQGLPGRNGVNGLNGVTTVIQIPGAPGRQGNPGIPGVRGQRGSQGVPGIAGRNGVDVNPADVAGLRALIISQHAQTRSFMSGIGAKITAALAPIFALCTSIFNIVNTASNAAQLALLNIINSKLGASVTGGISGLITNIAQNTYVEKALAVLTFATTLHNALMLTNNLGQTLGSIINTVLGLILPKGLDGTPLDINVVLGKTTEFLIKEAIGEANYTQLTQEWAKANRIYQATINVFNALQNAQNVMMNALEVIGGQTSKIGNALKKWGVVGEKAYEWFNPQPNYHNRAIVALENAQTAAQTIETVVQVPVSIVDAKAQIQSADEEFKSAIKGDKNPDGSDKKSGIAVEENKPKKDEFDLGKSISQAIDTTLADLFDGDD